MRIEKNAYLCHDRKQLIKRSTWNLEEKNVELFMMLQDQNLIFFKNLYIFYTNMQLMAKAKSTVY